MNTVRLRTMGAALLLSYGLTIGASAQPATWLSILNSQREKNSRISEKDVVFAPKVQSSPGDPVSVGFKQSDGTLSLGSLIWQGKAWSPLDGYAQILKAQGFAEADDETRTAIFLQLLESTNVPLGTWVYTGKPGKHEERPQPPVGYRQTDGRHRFVVWVCEEPGNREGPEWRRVLYLVDAVAPSVQARTLSSFHPVPEGLKDFPAIPSESSE